MKKLRIESEGSPETTHIFIDDKEISCLTIKFECSVDDIVVDFKIQPSFDIKYNKKV